MTNVVVDNVRLAETKGKSKKRPSEKQRGHKRPSREGVYSVRESVPFTEGSYIVKLIHKISGYKDHSIASYRPISLINIFSRLFELVKNRK